MRIIVVFISIFFFFNNFSFAKSYKLGDKISDRIELYKKYTFELPDGDWTIADKFSYSYYGIISKGYTLLRIKNNKAIESFEIAELKAPGRFQDIINIALVEIMFKNKYDGCYERPEYYKLEFFAKGSTHNCFWILHSDVYKELNDPDDPELRGANTQLKAWIRENNIELPQVGVGSLHSYFSRLTGGKWFVISHGIDPEILGAPKSKFVKEDRSEYHKHNISEYPEHKKIMEFGAFVNFLGKQDGLVHISELADKRVAKVTDIVKEGDEVKVKVIGFDRGKVKLSMKQAAE